MTSLRRVAGGLGRVQVIGLLTGALAFGSLTAAGSAGTHLVPADIDPTGVADVTAPLQRFLRSVPDGATIHLGRDATYRVEGSLVLGSRRGLTIEGNGARLVATTRGEAGRAHVKVVASSDIVIRDLAVRGANPYAGTGDLAYRSDVENQHGFQLSGVDGVLLERVTVTDVFGDFVYLGAADRTGWSRDVVIRDSHFERNGRQGFGVTAAEDVLIERNRIAHVRRATVDIEPHHDDGGAKRFRFVDNSVGAGRLHFFNIVGHRAAAIEDIEVRGNRIGGQQLEIHVNPPDGVRPQRLRFVDNATTATYGSSTGSPIRIRRSDDVLIAGNRQPLSEREEVTAIMLRGSCGVTIEDNEFPGAAALVDSDDPDCAAAASPSPVAAPSSAPATAPSSAPAPAPTAPSVEQAGQGAIAPPARAPIGRTSGDAPASPVSDVPDEPGPRAVHLAAGAGSIVELGIELVGESTRRRGTSWATHAVICRDDLYADCLAGAALAGAGGALLFVPGGEHGALPAEVATALEAALRPDAPVYVLGGERAVARRVADELAGGWPNVRRLYGASRIETAVAVATEVVARNGRKGTALVARDDSAADAVTGGAAAGARGIPILLTSRSSLHPATAAALAGLGVDRTLVLGGPAAIDPSVEVALRAAGRDPQRVAGRTRSETSVAVAVHPDLWGRADLSGAVAVIGLNGYHDETWALALGAAPLAAASSAPILLTGHDEVPSAPAEGGYPGEPGWYLGRAGDPAQVDCRFVGAGHWADPVAATDLCAAAVERGASAN